MRAGEGTSFLLRRLHSLSGVVPIGAFLLEHFISNAEAFKGPIAYGKQVEFLNSLPGVFLLELFFIWIPILYHGLYGVYIWYRGETNVIDYPWSGNWLYTSQRWTGIIAFVYMVQHTYLPALYRRASGDASDAVVCEGSGGIPESMDGRLLLCRHHRCVLAFQLRPVAVRREVGHHSRGKSAPPLWLSLPRACPRLDFARRRQHDWILQNAAAAVGFKFRFGKYRDAVEIEGSRWSLVVGRSQRCKLANDERPATND